MASNFVLTINSVDSESINFSISFTSGAKDWVAGYPNANDKKIEETYSLQCSLTDNSTKDYGSVTNGGNYSYNYIRPSANLGNLQWTLQTTLTVTQKTTTGTWGSSSSGGSYYSPYPESGVTYTPNDTYPTQKTEKVSYGPYPQTDLQGNVIGYYYQVVQTITNYTTTSSTLTQTLSDNDILYPRPANFTFNNCESGKQWKVDEGINSLITNIQDFYLYATQWKSWKQQSAASQCPQFDSPISAAQMNEINNYVSASGSYSKGDQVSAVMFNSLASAINSG